jgi:glycerophosphoryl diester phosphodiesterase
MPIRPLLLAHRGASIAGLIGENSVAAFDRAMACGCDGFEFDLRLTSYGQAVVCHNAKAGSVAISRATRQQLLQLPCFEDVLRCYGRLGFLDIELKVSGLETTVLASLRDHPPEREYVISSFLPEVVLELKARSAIAPVGIICAKPRQLVGWRKLPVEYVIVHQSLVTRKLVHSIHDAGRKIFVWTVNTPRAMLQFCGWEVDGIISDSADLLVQTLGGRRLSNPVSERTLRSAIRFSPRLRLLAG